MATASVLGVFAHVDTTLQAIRDLRAKGFSDLTVYTPVPVEEIEHEVEKVRSEERRVGKECKSQCRSRWSPYH